MVQIARRAGDSSGGKEGGAFRRDPVKIVRDEAKAKVDPNLAESREQDLLAARELVQRSFSRVKPEEETPDDDSEE